MCKGKSPSSNGAADGDFFVSILLSFCNRDVWIRKFNAFCVKSQFYRTI